MYIPIIYKYQLMWVLPDSACDLIDCGIELPGDGCALTTREPWEKTTTQVCLEAGYTLQMIFSIGTIMLNYFSMNFNFHVVGKLGTLTLWLRINKGI